MLLRLGPSTRRCVVRTPAAHPVSLGILSVRCSSSDGATKRKPRAKAAARPKPVKTVLEWGELPTSLVGPGGEKVAPLSEFNEVTSQGARRRPASPRAGPAADDAEEAEYQEAVRTGTIPETPLAKLVWQNWRRFPDCILLTQVGNFYESYFEPAIRVSSILGIKLTSKTYKSGTFPFTGFPVHRRDKYLKLLVHDLGYTVALVEEDKDLSADRNGGNGTEEVNRRVARVVTPGTLVDEAWLTGNESRYLLAIALGPPPQSGPRPRQTTETEETEEPPPLPLFLAYADVSTGEFFTKEGTSAEIEDELARIAPREIVLDGRLRDEWAANDGVTIASSPSRHLFALLRVLGVHVSFQDIPEVVNPPGSGLVKKRTTAGAARAVALERQAIALLRRHLEYALRDAMPEMPAEFNRESPARQMHIDAATLQALEIRTAFRPGGLVPTSANASASAPSSPISVKGTLISTLSRTVTDSGQRLLKRTLSAPSTHLPEINARLALVAALVQREHLRTDVRDGLRPIADVIRIVQRFRAHSGEGHDVWTVARWVRDVERLLDQIRVVVALEKKGRRGKKATAEVEGQVEGVARLEEFVATFAPLSRLADDIENAIDEVGVQSAPPTSDDEDPEGILAAGDAMVAPGKKESSAEAEERKRDEAERQRWWIKPSFSTELTELHKLISGLHERRDSLEARLRAELGAPTLTLGTSLRRAFIVTVKRKTELGALERSGRFHTISETRSSKTFAYSEWSALGARIEKALAQLAAAQARALRRLRTMVIEHADTIQANAELVDELDLTAGFAQAAVELNLTRPELHNGTELEIINGRHPAVEAGLLASSRVFTPNTTRLTPAAHLHVITGPNQGGKSTLLRQTAVIAILAQAGSFVPAEHARVGLVDRVFSRVGARDDLFRDRSTFMLEMVETAAILRHATPRSLVIMDEIGRGTTLHAGVSIAYATLDYILREIGCRTLFATHYHELAGMLGAPAPAPATAVKGRGNSSTSSVTPVPPDYPGLRAGVAFFCTDVDELGGARFAYSYRLRPGVNYDSHAIKAAQLAGMPQSFLDVAEKTLAELNTSEAGT